jgi:photosystem II stability/assembly factor-like uncharacterized protein
MKIKQFILLVLLLPGFTIQAQENFSVSTKTLLIDAANKSTNSFNVNSVTSWSASSNQSWLTVQPSSFESNPYAGAFFATGVRVHPTAGNLTFNNLSEILTLVSSNPTTIIKPRSGDYTFQTQIQITNNTIVVGGKTMYKVLVSVNDTLNTTGTGMLDTDQNGLVTNYFDPSTKTYYISYFYNTAAPRKIYEILSAATTTTNVIATAQENPTSLSREATITISSIGLANQTVTVTQAASPVLSVSANSLVIAASANSSVSFQLKSTTTWSVASDQSWLTANKLNGSGSTNIELTAADNFSSSVRTATITITVQGITKTINVTQYGTIPSAVAWNQFYTGRNYSEISVVNDNVIWLCRSADSTISYTKDGGKTLITKTLPAHISSNTGFCAVSETTAYIISADTISLGLWKTTDGANTWALEPTGYNKNNPANFYGSSFPDFVYFWDVNNGIIYGDDDEVYITNNAGSQWNLVNSSSLPRQFGEWTYNNQRSYRVVGDAIYILVSNQSQTNRILKSNDKGITWSAIYPPTNTLNASFDFKDANNGLYVDYNTTPCKLFSTTDGGLNWTLINSTETLGYLKYIPNQNMYISTNTINGKYKTFDGIKYSINNGISWIKNPSFTNIFNENLAFSSSGTTFITGKGYVYSSKNVANVNTSLVKAEVKTPTTIDLTFSANIDLTSAQDTSHYAVSFNNASNVMQRIKLVSAQRDNLNQSLVHITLQNSLPQDTITIKAINLYDTNGFPLINGSGLSSKSLINNFTGIDEPKDSKYLVYPNPVKSSLYITGLNSNSIISIYDITAKLIVSKQLINNEVDVNDLPAGIYTLKITNNEGTIISKFVKN